MRRCFVVLIAMLAVLAGFVAPSASADTTIGNLGDTLRVNFKGIVADVTVHDVLPVDPPPPGYIATGSPRWINQGGPWKALVTIHVIQAPTSFAMAKDFAFDGVTPYADAYLPKNTDAPDELQYALRNAPPGATVNGAVYWQVYRALVTNVVLLNRQSGEHLAQWNLWQPGAPLP
ncbi:MAG: hypothetical protein V7643_3608 [Mycobacterium sp.]